jgi:uncharacterized membrane protein YhaH (DUF805 family)
MIEKIASAVVQSLDFHGRANRTQYWTFQAVVLVFYLLYTFSDGSGDLTYWIGAAGALALFLPAVAITVRRLHDIDMSGWWILLGLLPFADLVLIGMMLIPGAREANKYGPAPSRPATPTARPAYGRA